jgi:hypothetical protein
VKYGERQLAALATARQDMLEQEKAVVRRLPDAAKRVARDAPLQALALVGGTLGSAWLGSKLIGRLPALARATMLLAMAPVRMQATRFVVGAFDEGTRPQ